MSRLAKPLRIIGLLSAVLALSACSAVKLGYNALPQVAVLWLDGYIDMGDEQKQRVRDELERVQQWHRRQELPKVAALLQRAERMAASDATQAEICALVPDIRARFFALAEGTEPAAATLALSLTAGQLDHLERRYQKNNAKYRKEWIEISAEDLKDKRFKQYVDRMEIVYGRLDEPQRAVMRSQVERTVFNPEMNLQERQRRQQDILLALRRLARSDASPAQAKSTLHGLVERGLQSPDPRYRAYQESLIQEGCSNLAAAHHAMTPQQRQNAARRLGAYQRDLEELGAAH